MKEGEKRNEKRTGKVQNKLRRETEEWEKKGKEREEQGKYRTGSKKGNRGKGEKWGTKEKIRENTKQ